MMKTAIEIVRKTDQRVSTWTGGTTTQLAIYPAGSDYRQGDFLWRMSSARVDAPESTFTPLPGVHRHLMVLRGRVCLFHEGREAIELRDFAQTEFEGDWLTRSVGQCVDFNLMTVRGRGALEAVGASRATTLLFAAAAQEKASQAWEGVYCLVPELALSIEEGHERVDVLLREGDFMLLRHDGALETSVSLAFGTQGPSVLAVRASVWLRYVDILGMGC